MCHGNITGVLQNIKSHLSFFSLSKTYLVHKDNNRGKSTSKREKCLGELLSISKPLLTDRLTKQIDVSQILINSSSMMRSSMNMTNFYMASYFFVKRHVHAKNTAQLKFVDGRIACS